MEAQEHPRPFRHFGTHLRRGLSAGWWRDAELGFPQRGVWPIAGLLVGVLTFLGFGRRRRRRH